MALNNKTSRTVIASHSHTLNDLHLAIQEAFSFDNDHLYAFYMDNKRFSDDCYNHPYSNEGPFADEAEIGHLNLYIGQKFMYLFDFGDEWIFTVHLLKIVESEENPDEIEIVEISGKSPSQYGNQHW